MIRPTVAAITEALYARLPELYRTADEAQAEGPNGYPLLRFLSLLVDQLAGVDDLLTRLVYVPADERPDLPTDHRLGLPVTGVTYGSGVYGAGTFAGAAADHLTSDLVDPLTADAGWLPWLAQLVGVNITGLDVPTARAALNNPSASWGHGTAAALIREARRVTTPTTPVVVTPHYGGDPFNIAVTVPAASLPDYGTWATLKAAAPTWGDLEALGSMSGAGDGALRAALERERPAAYDLTVLAT